MTIGLWTAGAPVLLGQNLVLNPSFELQTGCPNSVDEAHFIRDWSTTNDASPDYFNACGGASAGVPANLFGFSYAQHGSAMVGMVSLGELSFQPNYREYLTGRLSEGLEAGREYRVGYWVSTAELFKYASNGMGMYLADTVDNTFYGSYDGLLTDAPYGMTPQLVDSGAAIVDTAGWVQLEWIYTAAGGERNVVIGNFVANTEQDSALFNPGGWHPYGYYFFDNVKVERIFYPPTAVDDSLPMAMGESSTIFPVDNDSDPDGFVDAASFSIWNPAAHGSASYSPGTGELNYTADAAYVGLDSIGYRICDDEGLCDSAWIHIRIDGQIQAPIAVDDAFVLDFGASTALDLLDNDLQGSLPFAAGGPVLLDSVPEAGILRWESSSRRMVFDPVPGHCGAVVFRYRLCDAEGRCDEANVSLSTDCPQTLCVDDAVVVDAGTLANLSPLANDLPGYGAWATGSLRVLEQPTAGFAYWQNQTLRLEVPETAGAFALRYAACDQNGSCDSAWIQLRVEAEPDGGTPVALVIPNVITPNGDGFNDRWRIDGLADYADHELYIVNRWESTVFQTQAYRQDWDGEGLPDGTYFYLLRVRPTGGQERLYRGAITLLR